MKTAYSIRISYGSENSEFSVSKRPECLAAETIEHLMAQFPDFEEEKN
jgi:hypothetical protein